MLRRPHENGRVAFFGFPQPETCFQKSAFSCAAFSGSVWMVGQNDAIHVRFSKKKKNLVVCMGPESELTPLPWVSEWVTQRHLSTVHEQESRLHSSLCAVGSRIMNESQRKCELCPHSSLCAGEWVTIRFYRHELIRDEWVQHYLYLYLYSEWEGPNPEVGRV